MRDTVTALYELADHLRQSANLIVQFREHHDQHAYQLGYDAGQEEVLLRFAERYDRYARALRHVAAEHQEAEA